jgi:signal peptide peptidase SppA
MKNYSNFREYFSSQLWAIRSDALSTMAEVLELRIKGTPLTTEEVQARINGGQRYSSKPNSGTIAILPLYGVIDQKVSLMQQISGGTSVNDFMDAFRAALNDTEVTGIVFDVDSPGGSISGIPEAANEILSARGKKPIIAVANPMIASAAYWLSCAADQVICMPSGQVGSIGVIAIHDDYSVMNEKMGYKPTYITYGAFKGEGNSDMPLSEDAKNYRQEQVDTMGTMFTQFVAKARKLPIDTVRTQFGQGRMLLAKDAQSAGMIDGVGTMEQTLLKVSKTPANTTAMALSASDGDDECSCQCNSDCECGGTNSQCCGNSDCNCCSPNMQTKDFSTMKVKEATNEVLVGLDSTLQSWDGLIDRQIAGGKQLSKSKTESILNLQKTLGESKARIDGTLSKLSEPVVVVAEEEQKPTEEIIPTEEQAVSKTDATESSEQSRLRLTLTLRNRSKINS